MVIKNSTPWNTAELRLLFRRCIKEVERVEKPNYPFHKRNKNFQLDILNSNVNRWAGRASINGYWMMIKIPISWSDNKQEMEFKDKQQLSRIIIHEYYHTIGYSYFDKNNYKHDSTKDWNVDWIKNYPITRKLAVSKPKEDVKLVRYQQAIINLRKAETRLKRAKTIYQKWLSKTNYYQKVYNYNP